MIYMISRIAFVFVLISLLSACAANYESALKNYNKGEVKKAREEWVQLAVQGDVRSMYQLFDIETYPSKSDIEWLKKAAELKYMDAQFAYGNWLVKQERFKEGIDYIELAKEAKYAKAAEFITNNQNVINLWLKAENNDSVAMFQLAENYEKAKNHKKAAYWYEKSANLGNEKAQLHIGYFYDIGQGVKQDYKIANEWYKKSALQGNNIAASNLGINYSNGYGTDINKEQAFYWFKKGATDNNNYYASTNAISSLGRCYLYGVGTKKDTNRAYKLLTKVANNNQYAAYHLAMMYYKGIEIKQDYKLSKKWFLVSANKGYSSAQYYLGMHYYQGLDVNKDFKQAIEWFKKSANQGDADAQFRLAWMYSEGEGVNKNYRQAFNWYTKAAEQGHSAAQNNLGVMYASGQGTAKDDYLAFKWYKKAAEQGDDFGQNNLGNRYQYGKGVTQSYQSALYWYAKAAQQNHKDAQANLNKILYRLKKKYIAVNEASIYEKSDFDSKTIKNISRSTDVYVLSQGSTWTEVYIPEKHTIGYIHNSHLS